MVTADDKSQKCVSTVNQLLEFGNTVAMSTVQVPGTILARATRAVELRRTLAYHVGIWGHYRGYKHSNASGGALRDPRTQTWKTSAEKKEHETGDRENKKKETGDGANKPVPASRADEDKADEAAAAALMLMNRFAALDVEGLEDSPEDEKKTSIAVEDRTS